MTNYFIDNSYFTDNYYFIDNSYFTDNSKNITLYHHDLIKKKIIYKYFLHYLEKNIFSSDRSVTITIKYYYYYDNVDCLYYEKIYNNFDYYIFDFSQLITVDNYNEQFDTLEQYCLKHINYSDNILYNILTLLFMILLTCFICNYRAPNYGNYRFRNLY